jgi:hypothetical protein
VSRRIRVGVGVAELRPCWPALPIPPGRNRRFPCGAPPALFASGGSGLFLRADRESAKARERPGVHPAHESHIVLLSRLDCFIDAAVLVDPHASRLPKSQRRQTVSRVRKPVRNLGKVANDPPLMSVAAGDLEQTARNASESVSSDSERANKRGQRGWRLCPFLLQPSCQRLHQFALSTGCDTAGWVESWGRKGGSAAWLSRCSYSQRL